MHIKLNAKNIIIIFVILGISLSNCQKIFPPALNPENDISTGTIPGLTEEQLQEHAIGDEEFSHVFTPQEGLGPIFNQASCNNCHIGNGKGAPNNSLIIRFGKQTGRIFDSLINEGGPDLIPNAIPGYLGQKIPKDANVFTQRIAPIVMGLGFIAALADSSILANAYPHDGVSGTPNYVNPTSFFIPQAIHISHNGQYIGRFGKKAIKVTLQDQVVFALSQDLGGITCDYNMVKPYNYLVGPYTGNNVQDPNVSAGFVNHLVMYLSTLKVPPRRDTTNPDVIAGRQLFNAIGCASCHIPTFITATYPGIPALSNKIFHPFSDFLLHDMGNTLDDGVPEGSAQSFQWRTAPLWGVGLAGNAQGGQLFLLHDGRANTFEQAISFHGGEAESRRTSFFSLSIQQQQQIIKFLKSL